jgi:RHS repeat-associated protein
MAMAVGYTNFGGMLVHENRGGVETEYVPDTLGSVMMCRSASGTTTYTADYWPYGEVATSAGANPSPWGFVGALGYYTDAASGSSYVRARYLQPAFARWLTVDLIAPELRAYIYADCSPCTLTDKLGLWTATAWPPVLPAVPPDKVPCDQPTNQAIYRYCSWCYTHWSEGCVDACDQWASKYYDACYCAERKPVHIARPGEHWVPTPSVGIAPDYPAPKDGAGGVSGGSGCSYPNLGRYYNPCCPADPPPNLPCNDPPLSYRGDLPGGGRYLIQ